MNDIGMMTLGTAGRDGRPEAADMTEELVLVGVEGEWHKTARTAGVPAALFA